LSTLEATVKIEARARADMDRDMSDLKTQFGVQRHLLQAVSQTQSEHTAALREHTVLLWDHSVRLGRLEAGQERIEGRVMNLETGLATVQVGVQTIIGLLDRDIDGGESGQR
jgi:septal ring factor EnvC (AmiA/AmiB activator)